MSEPQRVPAQTSDPVPRQAQVSAEGSGRALVLSGGGIKGAYQIGAIVEVIDRGFRPTAIYGISIGALNGGMLASYVGEQILAGQPPDFLAAARRIEKYWHDNVTDFEKLGHQRSKLVLLWEVLTGNFKGMINVDAAIEIIRKEIRAENLRAAAKAGISFFAGTLNLSEGTYLDAEGINDQILEYIIASGMQPIVMPMRVIRQVGSELPHREDRWLDGGLHNVAPLGVPIDKNYKEIVCIVCRPDKLEPWPVQGGLTALGDRLSDVVAQRLLDNDIAQALKINEWVDRIQQAGTKSDVDQEFLAKFKKINLRIIRPAEGLAVDLLTFSRTEIERMIETGHRDAAAEMQAPPRQRTAASKLGVRAPSTKPSAAEAAARWQAR
jgi:NTE family protein